jgi:hypothetical protein
MELSTRPPNCRANAAASASLLKYTRATGRLRGGVGNAEAAWFASLVVEPCAHLIHPFGQTIFAGHDFHDVNHGLASSAHVLRRRDLPRSRQRVANISESKKTILDDSIYIGRGSARSALVLVYSPIRS